MSGFMSYFTGRRDPRESARDAIVGLRQQLLTLEKKQEFLEGKVEAEEKKAKQNATSNKRGASETEARRSCWPAPYHLLCCTMAVARIGP